MRPETNIEEAYKKGYIDGALSKGCDYYDCGAKTCRRAEPCDYISFPKGTLKKRGKGYVVYNPEWLKENWQTELKAMGIEPSVQPKQKKPLYKIDTDGHIEEVNRIKEIYNKAWQDGAEATAYHVELYKKENPTIPLSVIEDIKAEIEAEYKEHKVSNCRYGFGLLYALKVIDKHISGKEKE